ncbi:MAG: transposase [Gordonia amarae]
MTTTSIADQPSATSPISTYPVIVGVDTHQQTHHGAVCDHNGVLLGHCQFEATRAGYAMLWVWACAFSTAGVGAAGIESTGSYGAGLTQYLLTVSTGWADGCDIREVCRPDKTVRARRGKSDAIDAETAARAVLSGTATAIPKIRTGVIESIRVLMRVRDLAVRQHTACVLQLRDLITCAPEPLRSKLLPLTATGRVRVAKALRPDLDRLTEPAQATKYALVHTAGHIDDIAARIDKLTAELEAMVTSTAPHLLALPQVGTMTAAQILISAGENIDRLTHEAAFARAVGTAPIPASSGKTNRVRLSRGGDRQANKTIHLLVVRRLGTDPDTITYMQRRQTEPRMTKRTIIRILKRYATRQLYNAAKADLLAA